MELNPRYRLAIILPSLISSAPIIYYKNISDFLIKYFDITVFYFKGSDEVGFNCETTKIRYNQEINFKDYDIFQSFGLIPDVYLSKNKSKIDSPIVSTIHSYIFFDLKSQHNIFISFFICSFWVLHLRSFNKLICLTNDMKKYYNFYFSEKKLAVIYSGHTVKKKYLIDPDEVKTIKEFKSNKILLGVFANITYQKGIDHVIKFISSSEKYNLLVIGDGVYLSKLKKIAKKYNAIENCLFIGRREYAHRYFKLIDIYILSSYQEGFGLVGLESSIYKIPIICNDIPVFREIYNEQSVCFYNSSDGFSFHRALEKTIRNYDFYSKNLHELSQIKYNIDVMNKSYYELYLSLIEF
jgi:hypothetical protein